MRLVKFQRGPENAQGVLYDDEIHVVGDWRAGPAELAPFTLGGQSPEQITALLGKKPERVPLAEVRLAVPFDPLRKIICVGVNYRDHAGEIAADAPAHPILFTRSLDSLVAHGEAVIKPRVSETFDFEGEIAIVIGRQGRHIAPDAALGHVGGYTCFLDGSVREYQRHALMTGKNFWRSGSMGPWIVTTDTVGDADLRLQTLLNGEPVQAARASQMIFDIPAIIAYCSRWTVLKPGDVIATGTPGGVGSRRTPPLWMKPGDVIEVQIEQVGDLRNPVESEA